jgi:hypothetical protein
MSELSSLDFNAAHRALQIRTSSAAWGELEGKAESIAHDIRGDFPEMDVSYDVYAGWLDLGDGKGEQLYGVIDMGEAFKGAYVYDQEWQDHVNPAYTASEWPWELQVMIAEQRAKGTL